MNYRQYDSTIGRFYSQDVLPELSSSITFSIIQLKKIVALSEHYYFNSALNYSGLENNLEVVLLDLMQTARTDSICVIVLQKIIYYE
jgi:hypothetical protein